MAKYRYSFDLKSNTYETVKFIHASDVHLGAAQYRNEDRANDFIQAFTQILELGIKHHVDFILLAGDVFTSLEILPGLLIKTIKLIKDFKNFTKNKVLIIGIEGNHDIRKFSRDIRFNQRSQSWLKLLNNLELVILLDGDLNAPPEEIFRPYNFKIKQGGKVQVKNIVIYGTRYLGENPLSSLSKVRKAIIKRNDVFNILLQHFGIDGQMENVPGVKLEHIQPLRHRVDYLALGHFHKQFVLEDWIYNPGSSEAACSIGNSFKRGIFLVEISKKSENFIKKVKAIRLINREYIWASIYLKYEFINKKGLERFIIKKLSTSLKNLNTDFHPFNPQKPILYLNLKGLKPNKSLKIIEKDLREKLCDIFPIVDVKIYQKFKKTLTTLDNYILT